MGISEYWLTAALFWFFLQFHIHSFVTVCYDHVGVIPGT